MIDSEHLTKTAYQTVVKYLQNRLGLDKMSIVTNEINQVFPSWEVAWQKIRSFLKEHPMTNMQKSIHSFAQLFPGYESFVETLDNALTTDEAFWKQVYINLYAAKKGLEC